MPHVHLPMHVPIPAVEVEGRIVGRSGDGEIEEWRGGDMRVGAEGGKRGRKDIRGGGARGRGLDCGLVLALLGLNCFVMSFWMVICVVDKLIDFQIANSLNFFCQKMGFSHSLVFCFVAKCGTSLDDLIWLSPFLTKARGRDKVIYSQVSEI